MAYEKHFLHIVSGKVIAVESKTEQEITWDLLDSKTIEYDIPEEYKSSVREKDILFNTDDHETFLVCNGKLCQISKLKSII